MGTYYEGVVSAIDDVVFLAQAGINHRASAITQTGVNPYKAEGHVPNFINTTSQMARPQACSYRNGYIPSGQPGVGGTG
jgi:hypothetical protein